MRRALVTSRGWIDRNSVIADSQQRRNSPSGTPESRAPSQSADSDTRNVPCQPQGAGLNKPFDTCKYLTLGAGIRPPRATSIANPKYTDAARKAKINGIVVVAVAINDEGGVDDVKIVRGLGYGLDQNAMAAARQCEIHARHEGWQTGSGAVQYGNDV